MASRCQITAFMVKRVYDEKHKERLKEIDAKRDRRSLNRSVKAVLYSVSPEGSVLSYEPHSVALENTA